MLQIHKYFSTQFLEMINKHFDISTTELLACVWIKDLVREKEMEMEMEMKMKKVDDLMA